MARRTDHGPGFAAMGGFRFDCERGSFRGLRCLVTGRRRLGLVVLVSGLLVLGVASQASAAACKSPTAQPANPGGRSQLNGVAATAGCNAWAVGSYSKGTLIEQWNGTAWTIQSSPNPTQNGVDAVAATSRTNAWAVGDSLSDNDINTLIEHWDGTAWTVQPSPSPGTTNQLNGVAATSPTNAWVVGDYYFEPGGTNVALIEHWDGTAWAVQPAPSPQGYAKDIDLYGVAATSSTNAWAVGSYSKRGGVSRALIDHWNGKTWRLQPSPNPSRYVHLVGVAATSSKNAWAVGTSYQGYHGKASRTLIEHWNGKAWKVQRSPNPGGSARDIQMSGAAATSSKNAWAVGSYNPYKRGSVSRALIEHWNGKAWKIQRSPNRIRSALLGLAATSSTNAWTVGYYTHFSPGVRIHGPFALHWDGSAWKG